MASIQPSFFDRKPYTGVFQQTIPIEQPTADCTVLQTLAAYHAYLQSGDYSKYMPDDFNGDVKKFGLFVKEKKPRKIRKTDIQQWIGELKKIMTENLRSHQLFSLAGERKSPDR